MDALERIEQALQPTRNTTSDTTDRVHSPRVNSERPQDAPRVRFADIPPSAQESSPRLVVARPQEPVVARPQEPVVRPVPNSDKPKPILKPSKYINTSSESIASRVKARHQSEPFQNESIAERVARRRRKREAVHSVLDQETGQLLEYRQLLKHPRFKEVWNRSAADEFGRLAQGIGGRIKGTDTI